MKYLSSIFSFDTLDPAGIELPKGCLWAVSLVLVVEITLHLAAPTLPDPVLWGAPETSAKVAQATARAQRGETPVEVLIVGPSHAEANIRPAAMNESVPQYRYATYNGGMNGRTYSVLEFVYSHVYGPALRPRCVVLGVSPLMVNKYNEWMERNTSEFFAAPAPRSIAAQGWRGAWRRFLVDQVYLYRYRSRQRGLAEGFVGTRRPFDADGYRLINGLYTEEDRVGLRSRAHPYQQAMKAFEFGGPSAEAFDRLLTRLSDEGVTVVVVNMPFRPELLAISPTGRADYEDYLRHMSERHAKFGFVWLDYQRDLPLEDADFSDVDHLNSEGASELSCRLAHDLVGLLCRQETPR